MKSEVGMRKGEGGKQTEGNPFGAVQSVKYWSSSTNARRTGLAWGVDFGNGSVGRHSKTSDNYVWCVKFYDML